MEKTVQSRNTDRNSVEVTELRSLSIIFPQRTRTVPTYLVYLNRVVLYPYHGTLAIQKTAFRPAGGFNIFLNFINC